MADFDLQRMRAGLGRNSQLTCNGAAKRTRQPLPQRYFYGTGQDAAVQVECLQQRMQLLKPRAEPSADYASHERGGPAFSARLQTHAHDTLAYREQTVETGDEQTLRVFDELVVDAH